MTTTIKRAGNATKMPAMSQAEFDAIGKLMRLRDSACRKVAEMVLVQGKTAFIVLIRFTFIPFHRLFTMACINEIQDFTQYKAPPFTF